MGAKNLATKVMVAALLSEKPTIIKRIPNIGDVQITKKLLISIGVKINWKKNINTMYIDSAKLTNHEISLKNIITNRIPILILNNLLHRLKKAIVPTVKGDHIGKRNIDFHINAIKKFGAKVIKKKTNIQHT